MEEITVTLLKGTLDKASQDQSIIVEDETEERVKLSALNYDNERLLKAKGYLLHKVVKELKEVDGIIELHV